jgi:hypothetical protein
MLPDWNTEDYLGIIFVLSVIIIWPIRHRCPSWYYTILARFYSLVELFARTKFFIFVIFLYLVAKDACHPIIRVVKPWILAMFDNIVAKGGPEVTASATHEHAPRMNEQLLVWVEEDANDTDFAWAFKADTREAQLQRIKALRAAPRAVPMQDSDFEAICWSKFKMESRGASGEAA